MDAPVTVLEDSGTETMGMAEVPIEMIADEDAIEVEEYAAGAVPEA